MKKILSIAYWFVLSAGIFTLLGFISREKNAFRCKGLEVNIDRSDNNYFIHEEEIKDLFFGLGYGVDTQLLRNVDTKKIEKLVYNNPSAMKAEVYTTIDGKVKIDLKQRKPLLRIFNNEGESFYIDEDGWLMPLSEKFTSRVLIANGNIHVRLADHYKTKISTEADDEKNDSVNILKDLFVLTKYIDENEFWKAQIIQIHINSENEIELIPRVGNHIILFGDISEMHDKFGKLMIFYKKGLKKTGWNSYSHINLKFKDQVVCRRN